MKKNNLVLLFTDALSVPLALYLSFLLRFEFNIPNQFFSVFKNWVLFFLFIHVATFILSGLYSRIWRYTSLFDLYAILFSLFVSCSISYLGVLLFVGPSGYPRSVLILYPILLSIISIFSRLSIRVYYSHYHESFTSNYRKVQKKKLLLVGAGKTGDKIAREILSQNNGKYSIVGFIDDDKDKKKALLHGKRIFCGLDEFKNLKINYDEILITAPSANGDQMRRIVDVCKRSGKRYRTVPSINELIDGEINLSSIRDVSYSDLLGREEIKLDMNSIENMLQGRRVLITGAGGSIGSELVKQCLTFNPAEIVCIDFSEEKIYYLEQYFQQLRSNTILKTVLASIKNYEECDKIFMENQPQIVFHAAAYKHVPIQELYPWNAINTNIGGTLNIVKLSDKYKVDKFVLVSTDKAVNPVNVMGATKRVAEKLIQSYNLVSETCYMAVRFGNVLGSSGSAIPTFQKQINSGGPITITHPEMTRYFMSIQEASQLIIQCGSIGKDGEIFLLKMGKPIKIVQMAKDLIRLSGLEPEKDIPIVYTGLRPGEKLYEELQMINEKIVPTTHKKIMILMEKNFSIPWVVFEKSLDNIFLAAKSMETDKILQLLKQISPTYNPREYQPDLKQHRDLIYPIKIEA